MMIMQIAKYQSIVHNIYSSVKLLLLPSIIIIIATKGLASLKINFITRLSDETLFMTILVCPQSENSQVGWGGSCW